MRTTIHIDDDVFSEASRLSQRDGLTLSAALNLLARRGMELDDAATTTSSLNRSAPLRLQHEVHCIGTVLDRLDMEDESPASMASSSNDPT